jgi:hypothetical protein
VAQLGARFHGMEEVIGSIPIRSTNYFLNLSFERMRGMRIFVPKRPLATGDLPCRVTQR